MILKKYKPPLISIAIIMYCAYQSVELLFAWMNSRYDLRGWIAFIIWCIPILLAWINHKKDVHDDSLIKPILLGAGLFFSFQGLVGSMNFLKYIGLSLSLASLVPSRKFHFFWICSAISWMPVLGWIFGRFFPNPKLIFIVRILLALTASSWMVFLIQFRNRSKV